MKLVKTLLVLGIVAVAAPSLNAQVERKTPYWASLKAEEARMRTGPSTEFPVKWVYKRHNLPVRVIDVHSIWRKVEDPDGDQGWMHVSLLSPKRTAIVIGASNAVLRESPESAAHVSWRVQPGVVGTIDDCEQGWCRFENAGRFGYIEAERLWGDGVP